MRIESFTVSEGKVTTNMSRKKQTIGVLIFAANEFHRYAIDHRLKASQLKSAGLFDMARRSEEKAKVNYHNERIVQEAADELKKTFWQRFKRGLREWAEAFGKAQLSSGPFLDL